MSNQQDQIIRDLEYAIPQLAKVYEDFDRQARREIMGALTDLGISIAMLPICMGSIPPALSSLWKSKKAIDLLNARDKIGKILNDYYS